MVSFGFQGGKSMITTVRDTSYGGENAWYSLVPPHDIGFGTGGDSTNDFAKEEAVIYHEYSHYVEHWQLDPESLREDRHFNYDLLPEAGAMSEGIADYFACSASNDSLINEYAAAPIPYPYNVRDLNNTLLYPESMFYSIDPRYADLKHYMNARIIGGALWDMRKYMNEGNHPDRAFLLSNAHRLSKGPQQCHPTQDDDSETACSRLAWKQEDHYGPV